LKAARCLTKCCLTNLTKTIGERMTQEEKEKAVHARQLRVFLGALISELAEKYGRDKRGNEIVQAVLKAGTKVIDAL
jgi:hypothetical protein